MNYYAHTKADESGKTLPPEHWEPLFSAACPALEGAPCERCADMQAGHGHLNKVGWLAGCFAADMFAAGSEEAEITRQWAWLAGLWHDLGKYSEAFQNYLKTASKPDVHRSEITHKVDHATAGAQHACEKFAIKGRLLAHVIAGHHTGLLNWHGSGGMQHRLDKPIEPWQEHSCALLKDRPCPPIPPLPKITDPNAPDACRQAAFRVAFWIRMLFSTLVDADFLATEAFMNPQRAQDRPRDNVGLSAMQACLSDYLDNLTQKAEPTAVNRQRKNILDACWAKASSPPGFFSLCVPTGGGKTLSGLDFALRHATQHHKRRIIVAIPFTSIIDQTAGEYRKVFASLGQELVLEHHSNLDPYDETKENDQSRLRSENWDAPLIVTTNVQLFESLFACKTSRCRKLHRIANSVIVLDEAQTLPVELLKPTLWALRELVEVYGCTVVLSSATQPALGRREDFKIGLQDVREIMPAPEKLHQKLVRTRVEYLGEQTCAEIAGRLQDYEQGLAIVNTRKDAAMLAECIGTDEGHFHLSTRLCGAHREAVIKTIRQRLREGATCRVVSTQLIEAGVDVDFPVVFRASCGLDSLTQAAGRCNREGRREVSVVYAFDFPHDPPPGHLRQTADTAREILAGLKPNEDRLSPALLKRYFEHHYWRKSDCWDQHNVLDATGNQPDQMQFGFRDMASSYRLIRESGTPVFIPHGDLPLDAFDLEKSARPDTKGEELHERWFSGHAAWQPPRDVWRKIQRLCVQVRQHELKQLNEAGALDSCHEQHILIRSDCYDAQFGLRLPHNGTVLQVEDLVL